VLEFAGQMTQGAVRMAAAGGIDDPDAPIGTDTMKVLAASMLAMARPAPLMMQPISPSRAT